MTTTTTTIERPRVSTRRRCASLPAGDLQASIAWPKEFLCDLKEGRARLDGRTFGDEQKVILYVIAGQVLWRRRRLELGDRLAAGIADSTARAVLEVADVLRDSGYLIETGTDVSGRRQFDLSIPPLPGTNGAHLDRRPSTT